MDSIAAAYRMDVDYSAGTLWWGKEEILQERFLGWHPSPSYAHPLLSGKETPLRDYMSMIPMFVGTSGASGPVVVDDIAASGKKTSFGTLLAPGDIYVPDIKEGNYCEDEEWTVWRNNRKPRLSKEEMKSFLAFHAHVRKHLGRY